MEPRIVNINQKKLMGMRVRMTINDDRTLELWQHFMSRRKEIKAAQNTGFYSMQIYDRISDFNNFNTDTEFEKWAAVEVSDTHNVVEGMETYTLTGGKFAVFIHKGPAATFYVTLQFIFGTWLPNSEYELDAREHFEILREDYDPNNPESKEEVWVPIKDRQNE